MAMSSGESGMVIGTALGSVSNIIGLREQNKAVIGSIKREGGLLASHMLQINLNRQQIDRDLGDILSDNALATAKNMATAKVLMSKSGTIGGTTSQVSKQAYMEQIQADAEVIKQARNSEVGLLTEAVSRSMQFRLQSDATRSNITSPMSAFLQGITAAISGASQGAMMGQGVEGASSIGSSATVPSTSVPYSGTTASSRMSARNYNFNNYLMSQG